jgi:hypothetical protein
VHYDKAHQQCPALAVCGSMTGVLKLRGTLMLMRCCATSLASWLQSPAPGTLDQLHAEATAVDTVAYSHCPIHAVLDRIVISHTGQIMALWQVRVFCVRARCTGLHGSNCAQPVSACTF